MGLEATPQEWVDKMVAVADGVWRVLRDDGTFWINVGDSYVSTNATVGKVSTDGLEGGRSAPINNGTQRGITATAARSSGLKPKDLCLMPFRLALALQEAGWYVRSDICWAKKSPMPESVTDRPTSAWEHVFLLSKSATYFYDQEAVREPVNPSNNGIIRGAPDAARKAMGSEGYKQNERRYGRICGANLRNVWLLGPEPYPEAHFATFPSEIPRRAILAGTSEKGVCAACGAPWQRVVEKRRATYDKVPDPTATTGRRGMNRERPGPSDSYVLGIPQRDLASMLRTAADGRVDEMEAEFGSKWAHWTRTDQSGARVPTFEDAVQIERLLGITIPFNGQPSGWEASCACDADIVPCTVIDPFFGSGTSGAVAQNLQRKWVGIELNAEYCDLAVRRIQTQAAQMRLAI